MLLIPNNALQITLLILFNLTLISARRGGGGGRGGRSGGGGSARGVMSSPAVIVGMVVGCLAFVVLCILGALWWQRRQLAKHYSLKDRSPSPADLEDQMPYAQRVAIEDALALKNKLEAAEKKEKKSIFRW